MNSHTLGALLLGTLSSVGIAHAANYGTAGCGLGSLIFKDQAGIVQIFAATTNSFYGIQTFAITSGTSNCTEDGVAVIDREKEYFAEANFESLHQEMAKGQGETLNAFAGLMGCEGAGAEEFSIMAQAKYPSIFPNDKTTPAEMLGNVETLMQDHNALKAACKEKG